MKVLVATHNAGKVAEFRRLLSSVPGLEFVGLADLDNAPEVVEDGETFEANALKKAREQSLFSGLPTLADDSGLCVDALEGAPGIYSARFAGPDADAAANNTKLLKRLDGLADSERVAHFRCALAFVDPDAGVEWVSHGRLEGAILKEPRGEGGFGYDPLFLPTGSGAESELRGLAEMSPAEKNAISHRALAVAEFLPRFADHVAKR